MQPAPPIEQTATNLEVEISLVLQLRFLQNIVSDTFERQSWRRLENFESPKAAKKSFKTPSEQKMKSLHKYTIRMIAGSWKYAINFMFILKYGKC